MGKDAPKLEGEALAKYLLEPLYGGTSVGVTKEKAQTEETPITVDLVNKSERMIPQNYHWEGKLPLLEGATDFLGTAPILLSIPETGYTTVAKLSNNVREPKPMDIVNLPRGAVGLHSPRVKTVLFTVETTEDLFESVRTGVANSGQSHRPLKIEEDYLYEQKDIADGKPWLAIARKNTLIIQRNYYALLGDEKIKELQEVFEVMPFDLPKDYDKDSASIAIADAMKTRERVLSLIPGAVVNNEYWGKRLNLLANVVGSISEKDDDWPPSNKPIVVYTNFGATQDEKYQRAVDLVEMAAILRGKPIKLWSIGQKVPGRLRDYIPSLMVIDPQTCPRNELAQIRNVTIIDGSESAPEELRDGIGQFLKNKTDLQKVRETVAKYVK